MSGSQTTPLPMEPSPAMSTEFSAYLLHTLMSTIPVTTYDIKDSIRIWIKTFEQQAHIHGIQDMNSCGRYLAKYMPPLVQHWLPTLPATVISSWSLLREALVTRYGIPEEEDNRLLLTQLKSCKKNARESVRLHASKWEHLLSLITENYSEKSKITLFIKSLDQRDTRLTLTSLVSAIPLETVQDVINKAIELEHDADLMEKPKTQKSEDGPQPMDIDHFRQNQHPQHRQFQQGYHSQPAGSSNNYLRPPRQLRAFTRDGQPICDICYELHRTIHCPQYRRSQQSNPSPARVQNQNKQRGFPRRNTRVNHIAEESPGDIDDNDDHHSVSSFSVDLAHFARDHAKLPRSLLTINQKDITVLWDTGAEINGIERCLFKSMHLPLNKNESITYRDVNNNLKNTCGTAILPLFGTDVKIHVIDGISCPMIIGWDTIHYFKGLIDAENLTISLLLNNERIYLPISKGVHSIQHNEKYITNKDEITNFILSKYENVIAKDPDHPSVTHLAEFTIDTGDHPPIYSKPRIFHPDLQAKIDERLELMVSSGILEKIQFSEWGSQVRPVDKPDNSIRICGNYIRLNGITKPIQYPFPVMHHILQSLGQAKVFSKLDLAQGYFQIPIKQEHKEKTALVTVNGTYVFTVMPMGVRNAPAVFQSLMDKVLGNFKYVFAFAYQDDVIVFSRTIEEHKIHLAKVMEQFQFANLSIKLSKSQFILEAVEYLGFIVSSNGISANPDKLKPIVSYVTPTNLTELERFLGMTGVYQRFISQYQLLAEPLRRLKCKNTAFVWGTEQEQSFQALKTALCLLPTLKQPDFHKVFELHTDAATSSGIAVILCQRYDGTPYPLAFASRSLTVHEKKYSVREQECLSLIFGIKKFRPFLEQNIFYIFTDHSSLQWILNVKDDVQPRIWRWAMFLQAYDFKIFYVPGRENLAADALSRHSIPPMVQSIQETTTPFDWVTLQNNDYNLKQTRDNIVSNPSYTLINNILYKCLINKQNTLKNDLRVVVPSAVISDVCRLYHDSPFGGHFSYKKTKAKILQNHLWWNNMDQDIKEFCYACDLCQRIKGGKSHIYNHSNTKKDYPFQRVALDYWGPLPTSKNQNKYILVVIDTFSKFVELFPVASTNQEDIASTFFDKYILRHGVPAEILSDGGPPFNSMFNTQLSSLLGAHSIFTPPYHAPSNGIVERFMATLRRMILTYTEQPVIKEEWDKHLKIIQFVYNNTEHEATKHTPFYLVHGRHPKIPLVTTEENKLYDHYQSPSQDFALQLQERLNFAFDIVDSFITKYQVKENPFKPEDKVLLFNQTLSAKGKPRKLLFDWLGPFTVTKVPSKSTVNLKSDSSNKIVVNVHVSRLKKYKPSA